MRPDEWVVARDEGYRSAAALGRLLLHAAGGFVFVGVMFAFVWVIGG